MFKKILHYVQNDKKRTKQKNPAYTGFLVLSITILLLVPVALLEQVVKRGSVRIVPGYDQVAILHIGDSPADIVRVINRLFVDTGNNRTYRDLGIVKQ